MWGNHNCLYVKICIREGTIRYIRQGTQLLAYLSRDASKGHIMKEQEVQSEIWRS